MSIEFPCPGCNKLLRVSDASAGKQAKCPECDTIAPVPDAEPAAAPASNFGAAPAAGDNPFSSPQAVDTGLPPAGAPVGQGPIVPTQIDMGDCFSTAWRIFKNQWQMVVGAVLIVFIINMAINIMVSLAGPQIAAMGEAAMLLVVVLNIAGSIFSIYLGIGLAKILLAVARGQSTSFSELFTGGGLILPVLLATILVTLIVGVGLVLLIIPGIILGLMLSQYYFLIIDRQIGVIESLSLSRELTAGNKLTLFGMYLLAVIGGLLLILVTCGVGLLIVYPYLGLLAVVVYLRISGQPVAG